MGNDLYNRITDRIISSLQAGTRPWMQPWTTSTEATRGAVGRPLRVSGEPYSGINVLTLWMAAGEAGYLSSTWMTLKQANELGGKVRKGSRGEFVVFAKKLTKTERNEETGEDLERELMMLRGYTVFNVEQIEGLPERFAAPMAAMPVLSQRLANATRIFESTGVTIRHGGDRAYYRPSTDHIQMPVPGSFRDEESYVATLAHETIHSTSAETRLNRKFDSKRWGDEGYAIEELVAELGSAFLCADLGVTPDVRDDHAAYIASWLKVLQDDNRAIFRAASYAQRAVTYLQGLGSMQSDLKLSA